MLTVLNIAYPLAPVSPDCVGGAEQVLCALDRALVEAGHRSLVIACEGSVVAGELLATGPVPRRIDAAAKADAQRRHADAIKAALREHAPDVVHYHGVDYLNYLPPPGLPTVVTLHLPPSWYAAAAYQPREDTVLVLVSENARRQCPPTAVPLRVIGNGVAPELFAARHARRNFALALGRICPEKGFHHALDAAHAAEIPLLLAGAVFPYPEHEAYFRDEILPRLDRQRRYIGPVGFRRKRRLLAAARCLLVPSLVPETGALVAMEAMACGTPVVAFPSGALNEVVTPGETGFLVADAQMMAAAMHDASAIDPRRCRTAAARFDRRRMTDAYLGLYQELATGRIGGAARQATGASMGSLEPQFRNAGQEPR